MHLRRSIVALGLALLISAACSRADQNQLESAGADPGTSSETGQGDDLLESSSTVSGGSTTPQETGESTTTTASTSTSTPSSTPTSTSATDTSSTSSETTSTADAGDSLVGQLIETSGGTPGTVLFAGSGTPTGLILFGGWHIAGEPTDVGSTWALSAGSSTPTGDEAGKPETILLVTRQETPATVWIVENILTLPPYGPDDYLMGGGECRHPEIEYRQLIAVGRIADFEVDPVEAWVADPETFTIESTSIDPIECNLELAIAGLGLASEAMGEDT